MDDFVGVARFLREQRKGVLEAACASMARAHLPHYDCASQEIAKKRLHALYDLVLRCAKERHLAPVAEYVTRIAAERHAAGIELSEVQTAVNVLEEAVWRAVLAELPVERQGEALGVVSTILGAAKDRLACAYVSLATDKAAQEVDYTRLFQGAREGDAPSA